MEADKEKLFEEGWVLAQRFYAKLARRYKGGYLKDLVWDATVDGLFYSVEKYDGRIEFGLFLWCVVCSFVRTAIGKAFAFRRDLRRERMLNAHLVNDYPHRGAEWDQGIEAREVFRLAMNRLHPNYRGDMLQWLEGQTYEEIAAKRGVSYQSVQQRVRKAIELLQDQFNREAA